MMIFGIDLGNLVRMEIARAFGARPRRMVGLVDGYNSQDHTVKVKLLTDLDDNGQPKITGWIPFGTNGASEQGISFCIGPNVGDQVVIDHAEGDAEASHVSHVLHNTVDTPPNVASGQAMLQHNPTGNYFTINTDGSMQHFHKSTGNYVKVDKNGNITANIKSGTQHYIGGDPTLGHVMSPILTVAGQSPYGQARVS
jgi:hypothetical protein